MPEHPGPPTLSLALSSVIGAAVENSRRAALLTVVCPGLEDPRVVPFPGPRTPLDDDDPDAA